MSWWGDGVDDCLTRASKLPRAAMQMPLVMAAWVRHDAGESDYALSITDGGINDRWSLGVGNIHPVNARSNVAGVGATAQSVNVGIINQWAHIFGEFRNSTYRRAVLNGSINNQGTNTTASSPAGMVEVVAGAVTAAGVSAWGGAWAYLAIWQGVVFSDDDIIKLGRLRWHPALVHPRHLVWFDDFMSPMLGLNPTIPHWYRRKLPHFSSWFALNTRVGAPVYNRGLGLGLADPPGIVPIPRYPQTVIESAGVSAAARLPRPHRVASSPREPNPADLVW